MTSSPPVRRFDWGNLRLRVLSTAVLAPSAFAVLWIGGVPFLILISVACALLAIEWGMMSTPEAPARTAGLVMIAILAPMFLTYREHMSWALLALPLTAALAALIARFAGWSRRSLDIAFGVLYLGGPAVTLLWLRDDSGGRGWVTTLFAATWSADICAYAAGNVFKGPKLWPSFSPNKTWSGFGFGLAGAMGAAVIIAWLLPSEGGPSLLAAAPVLEGAA